MDHSTTAQVEDQIDRDARCPSGSGAAPAGEMVGWGDPAPVLLSFGYICSLSPTVGSQGSPSAPSSIVPVEDWRDTRGILGEHIAVA